MQTVTIEATQSIEGGQFCNHGKFLVGMFDEEWGAFSHVPPLVNPIFLLSLTGWSRDHVLVLDLETGEGAIFRPTGFHAYDLDKKHRIWVCPIFAPFLEWLYQQFPFKLEDLPAVVELPEAEFEYSGHRREGELIPRPCPFCHQRPVIGPEEDAAIPNYGVVMCQNPRCPALPTVMSNGEETGPTSQDYRDAAIRRWNGMQPVQEPEHVVDV